MKIHYESYPDIISAVRSNPSHENIQYLGEWLSEYGTQFWNGEYYYADEFRIEPIYKVMDGTDPEDELYDIDYYELRQ